MINARSRLLLSTRIEHLTGKSRLTDLHLRTNELDLGDLNSYLVANSTPATLRQPYLSALKQLDLANPQGKLIGQLDYSRPVNGGKLMLYSNLSVKNVGFMVHRLQISDVNGVIASRGNTIVGQNISGTLDGKPLSLNLTMTGLDSDAPAWTAQGQSTLSMKQIMAMLPSNLNSMLPGAMQQPMDQPIPIELAASGVWGSPKIAITGHALVSNTPIAVSGQYDLTQEQQRPPSVDVMFSLARPIDVRNLLTMLPSQSRKFGTIAQEISGQVGGEVHVFGPVNAPATEGHIDLYGIAIPSLHIDEITGSLRLTDASNMLTIDLQRLTVANAKLTDVHGQLQSESTTDGDRWSLDNLSATFYGGRANITGSITLNTERPFEAAAMLRNVDMGGLSTDVLKERNQVTGTLALNASVSGNAVGTQQELLQSLKGYSHFSLTGGKVKALAQLESGLSLLNIANEGILGTSVSDLISAVGHFHTGAFKTASGNANLHDGVVDFGQLSFIGREMRLRAQGDFELETKNAKFEVAGNIPRNASRLPGPLGTLLQHLSIANIFNTVTFGLTSHLPNIPLLGKLGVEKKPRAFTFVAQGNASDPKSFTKSVLQTFHWLPNERFATPHPVFGIGAPPEAVPQ